MTDDLRAACDATLIGSLSDALKADLRRLIDAGEAKADILARARRVAGGRTLTILAIEAYLDQITKPE